MANHIALLRAINVGPHNKVGMAALRDTAGGLGLAEPRTLLQSGNLVFDSSGRSPAQLEAMLQEATATQLGVATDFFVRGAKAWRALIDANPFAQAARGDPAHLVVLLFKQAPGAAQVKALRDAITGREELAVAGREAYMVYPDGIGTSCVTTALVARKLGTANTARNWNTVLKIAALLDS